MMTQRTNFRPRYPHLKVCAVALAVGLASRTALPNPEGKTEGPDRQRMLSMLRGESLAATGQNAQAIAAFEQIVKDADIPPPVLTLARTRIIDLALESRPPNLELGQRHLDAWVGSTSGDPAPAYGSRACRLLLARTVAAQPQAQAETWSQGVKSLGRHGGGGISQDLLGDLDGLLESGDRLSEPLRRQILIDLTLAAPDTAGLFELQVRRVGQFLRSSNPTEAMPAAKLALLLSVGTSGGPKTALERLLELFKTTGGSVGDGKQLEAFAIDPPPTSVGANAPTGESVIDHSLRQAATEWLKTSDSIEPGRHKAYLLLWSGQPQEGLRQTVQPIEGKRADTDIKPQDLLVIQAVAAGHWSGVDPSAMPVGEVAGLSDAGPGDRIASAAHRLWIGRVLAWGTDSLQREDERWADLLYSTALNHASNSAEVKAIVQQLAAAIAETGGAFAEDATLKALGRLAGTSKTDIARRQLHVGIAKRLVDRGSFDAAWEELEKVSAIGGEQTPDIDAGLTRVIVLIRLNRYEEAAAQLRQMSSWQGASEDLAHMKFLTGWLKLQELETDEALTIFKQLVDQYPHSSYTVKAKELIQRLGALEQ